MTYRPRGMPRRFLEGAPEIVRKKVLDMVEVKPAAPLDFDILFRPEPGDSQIVGLDFGRTDLRGCHFFLEWHEARAFRERNRRKRVAWRDLPAGTQEMIVSYLESE
ncbi:MAG: hypothetical protein WC130_11290 [Kiritimatiellia bacterium]